MFRVLIAYTPYPMHSKSCHYICHYCSQNLLFQRPSSVVNKSYNQGLPKDLLSTFLEDCNVPWGQCSVQQASPPVFCSSRIPSQTAGTLPPASIPKFHQHFLSIYPEMCLFHQLCSQKYMATSSDTSSSCGDSLDQNSANVPVTNHGYSTRAPRKVPPPQK